MFRGLGRACYRHRRAVVGAWLVIVLVGLPLVPSLPGLLKPGGFSDPTLESERAGRVLAEELGQRGAVLIAVFRPEQGTPAGDLAFLGSVAAQSQALVTLPAVERVVTPLENPRQVAPDGSLATVLVVLRGDPDLAPGLVPDVKRALGTAPHEPVVTGGPVAYADIIHVSEQDLRRAELISVPLALVALVVVFGSLVAAGAPVIVGGLSVLVALAVLSLIGRATDLSVFVLNLATMLGLGLGTDYSLFMTSRFREELARDPDVGRAVETTVDQAGRAVFFSGLTVFIGLLGLVSFDFMMLRSLGIGGAVVVALGVIAALTLLPALLGLAGHRINALSVLRWNDAQASFWHWLAHAVMRRPWATLLPVVAVLLLLGAPFLRARFSLPDAGVLPSWVESRRGYELLRGAFGEGEVGPMLLVVRSPGPILSPERVDALFDLSRHVAADPAVARVESIVDVDPRITRDQYKLLYAAGAERADPYTRATLGIATGEQATLLTVIPRCASVSTECAALLERVRALKPGADLELLVGGGPAAVNDIVDRLYSTFPRAVLLVVGTTYLILLVLFRSVLLPLKAILMNGLSLVASYGALVIVFQEGFGAQLLGFQPLGYVEATLPIIMFCLLFGLSMDYEVFLLTRVKEEWDRGADNATSVAAGLASSGRVITNAALIVVLVSLSFVTADVILVKAVGLGTALAVLLDATIVRALLVPATMRLLGDLNWWAPRRLQRALAWTGGALLLSVLLAGCANQPRSAAGSLPVPRAQPTASPTPAPVAFPRDDAPHGDLTEWWYYTGHLEAADGASYGFEFVVFQSLRGTGPVGYASHLAITDLARRRFVYDQRSSIGSQIGSTSGFDLDVGGWRMSGSNGVDKVSAAMEGYALDLALRSEKPPALHNGVGYISFGPAGDSYYYSRTRLALSGTLQVDGKRLPVTGVAWFDHQWGNFISAGGGWDWFSVHFDDRTELTGSVVRDDDGRALLVYGTYVDVDGRSTHLGPEEFRVDPLGTWTSPRTGVTYPGAWRLRTPGLDVELAPVLADQELDTRATTGVVYWEGAVSVRGTKSGRGYVELTGYRPTVR